jgi:hypothetical protein
MEQRPAKLPEAPYRPRAAAEQRATAPFNSRVTLATQRVVENGKTFLDHQPAPLERRTPICESANRSRTKGSLLEPQAGCRNAQVGALAVFVCLR